MPRRRRHSRKSRKLDLWRAGALNFNGEKPVVPQTMVRTGVTLGRWISQDVDAAGSLNFVQYAPVSITNFNDPLMVESAFHGFNVAVDDSDDRSLIHKEFLAHGFVKVRVMEAMVSLRIDVSSVGNEDWVIAWRFSPSYQPGVGGGALLPRYEPGDNEFDTQEEAVQFWRTVRNNPGWRYEIFSATQSGGSPYPSAGTINIPVPDVYRLGKLLNRGWVSTINPNIRQIGQELYDYEHDLSVSPHTGDYAAANIYLLVYAFKVRGNSHANNDVIIEVTVAQKVKVFRDTTLTLDDIPSEHA